MAAAAPLSAQAVGGVSGFVREAGETKTPLQGARLVVDDGRYVAVTDAEGFYRLREVPAGWHAVSAASIGHRPVSRDSVLIRSGQITRLDFSLTVDPVGLEPIEVVSQRVDSVLDPFVVTDAQRFTAEELRRLPVTTVEEAVALSAGAVGESYRGGRIGEQAFIVDGLGIKNQLDASTSTTTLGLPTDMLAETSLITNGFSARYGQAISALVNVVTRDGGQKWSGHAAYETDRPFGDGLDYGLDRAILSGDGPVAGGVTVVGAADLSGRMDADPVNAPAPSDSRDPRHDEPWLLPHNSGQLINLAGKVTAPLGRTRTLRLLAAQSNEQRFLYDPLYKYEPDLGPARRLTGTFISGHFQQVLEKPGIVGDVRVGYFDREFLRGTSVDPPDYSVGAFTFDKLDIVGEDIARRQDTVAGNRQIIGFSPPAPSDKTPWGVPAYYMGGSSKGDVAWNKYKDLRSRLDLSISAGTSGDFYVGGEYASQQVRTFNRVLGYLPAGDSVPDATASTLDPYAAALYAEAQYRKDELAFTAGLRYDQFSGRLDLPGQPAETQHGLSPRFAVSTVFKGATFVASYGVFRQPPDYQYLVDAAFDDTVRTGRFRQGNPNLGFEENTQYEFSLRVRPSQITSVRANLYIKRLDGLVASVPLGVNPDSSIFGNADAGSVKGLELILEREFRRNWGLRVSYTLQQANATSTSAFLLRQQIRVDPNTGDTTFPAKVEFPLDYDRRHSLILIGTGETPTRWGPTLLGAHVLADFQGSLIFRWGSGLPYSRTNLAGDSLVGLPNDNRLPSTSSLDMLVRRPFRMGKLGGSVYLDGRNILNKRNVVAVRRTSGNVNATNAEIQALVDSAYAMHPEPIPYESPRYRAWADLDHNGYVDGAGELMPLYQSAVKDYTQPLFFFGPPRLLRLGIELLF